MTPPATLAEARALAVEETLRRHHAAELATLTNAGLEQFRRSLLAEQRRSAFHVVRP